MWTTRSARQAMSVPKCPRTRYTIQHAYPPLRPPPTARRPPNRTNTPPKCRPGHESASNVPFPIPQNHRRLNLLSSSASPSDLESAQLWLRERECLAAFDVGVFASSESPPHRLCFSSLFPSTRATNHRLALPPHQRHGSTSDCCRYLFWSLPTLRHRSSPSI